MSRGRGFVRELQARELETEELRRRLSIDKSRALELADRKQRDAERWARRVTRIPATHARGRSRKLEPMLAAKKDAIFYRLLASRLAELDLERGPKDPPAIAFHALTVDELKDLDRKALHTLDGEIKAANYTPPGGSR